MLSQGCDSVSLMFHCPLVVKLQCCRFRLHHWGLPPLSALKAQFTWIRKQHISLSKNKYDICDGCVTFGLIHRLTTIWIKHPILKKFQQNENKTICRARHHRRSVMKYVVLLFRWTEPLKQTVEGDLSDEAWICNTEASPLDGSETSEILNHNPETTFYHPSLIVYTHLN